MRGPCAKQRVRCVIYTVDGEAIQGENDCANPQPVCPRGPGEGYEKCQSICQQARHAEVEAAKAVQASGANAKGARAILYGHYYACEPCAKALQTIGVEVIEIHVRPT